mgnify:CR=1 FL=1
MTERTAELLTAHLFECTRQCRELGYHPNYFEQQLHEVGGLAASRALLRPSNREGQTGFQRIMDLSRQDLTVEHAVLDERFSALFTQQERDLARWRLENPAWARGL